MVGGWVVVEFQMKFHSNWGKYPQLKGLKIRIFCLWHAARESVSMGFLSFADTQAKDMAIKKAGNRRVG